MRGGGEVSWFVLIPPSHALIRVQGFGSKRVVGYF